ncbi:MAG: ATP-binding protein [Solirubrobacteraceae bacterium]
MRETRSFPEQPESVTAARRFATDVLREVSPDVTATVELLVSELATNCIRHTNSAFDLTIIQSGAEIRVEATDYDAGAPTMRSPEPTDPSGRGLRIVDALAAAWGVEHRSAQGKTVWFTVVVPATDRAPEFAR